NGADTYRYTLGDGNDVITDFSYFSDNDRIVLTDQNAADVTFSQNDGHDLVITMNNGDTLTVIDHFANVQEDMEQIEFADGTVLDFAGISTKAINDQNGSGDDLVLGSFGNDVFSGGLGNDTLNGGNGADTYRYTLGDGNDVITDFSYFSDNDRIVLTDQNAADVTFSQNDGHDLVITMNNGDTLTVIDHFANVQEDMEQIEFADGTVLDSAGIAAKSLIGGMGNDVIKGFNSNDRLLGKAGDDLLTGGGGADTFQFNAGFGNDTISDFEDGVDMIQFNGGPDSFADLTISEIDGNTEIVSDDGASVTLTNVSSALLSQDDFLFQ
ncbi:hypothetical protein J7400_20805, partial [Shimia sp. R9_2]|uniref:calcium-binding protein n=1 Tax=Shimia sp. R9_2 TaxID=2821112 RepID=UPI001B0A1ECD